MRLLIERVKKASCTIDNNVHSSINNGFLVYVAFEDGDSFEKINKSIDKLLKLRVFTDENGKLNLDINQINGEILLISSFSLFADLKRGNRPTFERSIPYNESKPLYDYMCQRLRDAFNRSAFGVFGADMMIEAINDGPISVIYDL